MSDKAIYTYILTEVLVLLNKFAMLIMGLLIEINT